MENSLDLNLRFRHDCFPPIPVFDSIGAVTPRQVDPDLYYDHLDAPLPSPSCSPLLRLCQRCWGNGSFIDSALLVGIYISSSAYWCLYNFLHPPPEYPGGSLDPIIVLHAGTPRSILPSNHRNPALKLNRASGSDSKHK